MQGGSGYEWVPCLLQVTCSHHILRLLNSGSLQRLIIHMHEPASAVSLTFTASCFPCCVRCNKAQVGVAEPAGLAISHRIRWAEPWVCQSSHALITGGNCARTLCMGSCRTTRTDCEESTMQEVWHTMQWRSYQGWSRAALGTFISKIASLHSGNVGSDMKAMFWPRPVKVAGTTSSSYCLVHA